MRVYATLTAVALFILDQVLKRVAHSRGASEGLYTYTLNTGVTFGFFPEANTAMIALSIVAIALIVYVMRSSQHTEFFGLALVLTGVASNGVDRVLLGGVVDYVRIGSFPVFNLADALIIAGVALLIGLEVQRKFQNSSRSSKSSKKPLLRSHDA